MALKSMSIDELELLSNMEITKMIIEEKGKPQKTADLFKNIIKLLGLPESTFENKIANYYTQLSTDKNFVLLSNGKWDLRSNHKSDNIKLEDLDDENDDEEEDIAKEDMDMSEEDSYDDTDEDIYNEDDADEDLKDLIIIDEDDIELDN